MHPKFQERRETVQFERYALMDMQLIEAEDAIGRKVKSLCSALIGELEATRAQRQLKACIRHALSLPPTSTSGRVVRNELVRRLGVLNDYLDNLARLGLAEHR